MLPKKDIFGLFQSKTLIFENSERYFAVIISAGSARIFIFQISLMVKVDELFSRLHFEGDNSLAI